MSIRIPYEEVKETARQAFLNLGLSREQAEICATIHTQSSADGVESHGLNRLPRFANHVKNGWVNVEGKAQLVGAKGAVENYDGQFGIGIINALFCTDRAMELAKIHGIGCVALKNATHSSVLPQQMHPIRNVREVMLSVRVSVPLLQGIGA